MYHFTGKLFYRSMKTIRVFVVMITMYAEMPSIKLCLSLASGHASQHILSQFPSSEIWRVASGVKTPGFALTVICVTAADLLVVISMTER